MGAEVSKAVYEKKDFTEFYRKLSQETILLHSWIKNRRFDSSNHSFGVELEAWLFDNNGKALPTNKQYLNTLNNGQVVDELSKFNIEINGSPFQQNPNTFSNLHEELKNLWKDCIENAKKHNANIIAIGSLPTLTQEDLTLQNMSEGKRYEAINNEIFKTNFGLPKHIHITGRDELKVEASNVVVASAATSFQFQWKVPALQSKEYYNACMIATAPMVAMSANCPFLFGKSLWDESRVPLFEHSVVSSPRYTGQKNHRVGLGVRFLQNSLSEYFIETSQYPTLLPATTPSHLDDLYHLKLHNGTMWRWNRPVLGNNDDGTPHVRIEHRSPSAGPTLIDSIANMMFFIGMTHGLVKNHPNVLRQFKFNNADRNFYQCSKYGLSANVTWVPNRTMPVYDFLLNELIPLSKKGLQDLEFSNDEIDYYIDEILLQRLNKKLNGAEWQKDFIKKNKGEFKSMTFEYLENQMQDKPLYKW